MAYVDTLIDSYLTPMIKYFQELAVHDELARPITSGLNVFELAYQGIKTNLPYKVEKNGTLLSPDTNYHFNATSGQITFVAAMLSGDEIRADYYFQYFPRIDLENWFELTIQDLNSRKPISAYTLESAPLEWGPGLVLGTYMKCLNRILLEINTWKARLIWPDPAGFSSYLQSMRSQAQTEFDTIIKNLKRRGLIAPQGISSGKYYTMQLVNEYNFRRFSIIGASS